MHYVHNHKNLHLTLKYLVLVEKLYIECQQNSNKLELMKCIYGRVSIDRVNCVVI